MAKKNTKTLKFEILDKELQNLLYSRDNSKLISVLKEEKNPLHLEQLAQLDVKSCKNLGFPVLWSLYENDFIPFEENFLLEKLCDALFLMSKHKEIESFILKRPVIAEKLCTKLPFFLTDNFSTNTFLYDSLLILAEKGYFKDTQVLPNFLEILLSPLKTTTANSYCRLIEDFNPTTEELLPSQQTLFALLSSDKTSVVNFAIKLIKQIADEKSFDFQAFADNFALCFGTPKIAKTQLIGLNILEKYYKKQAPTNPDYREQLAVLFTVPDVKLQEKVANLLTTYFNHEGLPEIIASYRDYLKGKAQDLLATLSPSENSENSQTARAARTSHTSHTALTLTPVSCTPTPEKLLFLLGNCLRERTAATIDLFFEGLVQLQDQLPENFKEQLAPYIPQVNGMYYFNVQLAALQLLLAGWVEDRPLESPEEWKKMNAQVRRLNTEEEEPFKQACVLHNVWYLRDEIPYLLYKVKATLNKLKSGSKLPFLSTPTHAPFYMDAETLADRLLAYQTAGKEVDLDDLVVACNRLLLSTITPEAQEKVRSLSGQYALALGYLFGLSDVVTPTEELLPLWTQITRLKHPDKVFTEFETTTAKDYLSAVKPFFPSYEIEGEFKQFFLEKVYVDDYYNYTLASPFDSSVFDRLPYNCYNAGAYDRWDTDTLRYVISLNPQYVDVLLGKYTPLYVGDSDAETQRNLREPLQLLLEYDLPVHHGGWIFIGMALLHDKKETRNLAAEYILRAISRDEDLSYLQHFIADILAQKLTPINRFVEFLDMPTRDPKIKAFQKAVVEAYLPLAEKQEKKPMNHKKLANWLIC
ncbi:DUF6493 family protein [Capnocytophaga sputigena]|uniref:DUF6493 family protein n=2 Tax=Capnocytophaga sputigena TaxID=1019 RepID=UPI000BB16D56|nr:DUF6493 family protein [Capnocytophaga sputigena]ATA70154.1 hypothetical protein CGC57_04175 [Capnocytophaga sputigena]VEI53356.1 Uncharacterised protein [Capnocytophaga sputigena]